jgi:hypothetical protein
MNILLRIIIIVCIISLSLLSIYNKTQGNDKDELQTLKEFLAKDNTDRSILLKADTKGDIKFDGFCEEKAFQLRDRAVAQGIKMETEILSRSECFRWQYYIKGNVYSLQAYDGHYICKTVIGNDIWFIEPQNDKIWIAYHLD